MITSAVRLVRPLRSGGMGSVWLADHLTLQTQVVVKFVAAELATNAEALARFTREAAAAARVKSPHVVQMLDHGVADDGTPYIVMELLEGSDLADHLAANKQPPLAFVADVVVQVGRALTRAHERGVIHRDVKPHNIFLCDIGGGQVFVKLLDFGIAKHADLKAGFDTSTSAVVGSPVYMSPEQLVGAKHVDHRSDLWSLAIVMYQMLVGRVPFSSETFGSLVMEVHSGLIQPPGDVRSDLPKAVDAFFRVACATKPDERFQSAKELTDAFERALRGEAPERPAPPPATPSIPESAPRVISSVSASVALPGNASTPGPRTSDRTLRIAGSGSSGAHPNAAAAESAPDVPGNLGVTVIPRHSNRWVVAVVGGIAAVAIAIFAIRFVGRTSPSPVQASPDPTPPTIASIAASPSSSGSATAVATAESAVASAIASARPETSAAMPAASAASPAASGRLVTTRATAAAPARSATTPSVPAPPLAASASAGKGQRAIY